jgi:Cys-rich repeat protein
LTVALAIAACGSDTPQPKPVKCAQDSDCPSGEFCNPGSALCAAKANECTASSDCATSEACDTASGYCVFAGCAMDTDCAPGQTCAPSTSTCTGTPTTMRSCHKCACVDLLSAGGCANLCDSAQNGNPQTPNFCNGTSALPQCAKCLAAECGVTDTSSPSSCM